MSDLQLTPRMVEILTNMRHGHYWATRKDGSRPLGNSASRACLDKLEKAGYVKYHPFELTFKGKLAQSDAQVDRRRR